MVLDAGELKEFDTAANLLNTPGSIFASMVDDTGVESAKHLRQVWQRAVRGCMGNEIWRGTGSMAIWKDYEDGTLCYHWFTGKGNRKWPVRWELESRNERK